jgi:hypothetical protein
MMMMLLQFGCKKDENKLGDVNRITKLSYFENDEIKWIYDYSYKNERMVATDATIYIDGIPYHSNWEISYPTDDSIISIFTISDNSPDSREILELQDGLTISRSYDDFTGSGYWKPNYRYEYAYFNSQLTEQLYYHGGDGAMPDLQSKINYEYEGNLLVRILHYSMDGDWKLTGLDSISYNGDNLSEKIDYAVNDGIRTESRKYVYLYEGSLLTQMDFYKKEISGEWTLEENHFFTYNEFGDLDSKSVQLAPGAVVKYVIEYEGGKGNYRQFIYPGNDLWSPLLLPFPG